MRTGRRRLSTLVATLALTAAAPFALVACDMLKKGSADAGDDAAVAATATVTAPLPGPTTPAAPTGTPTGVATLAPGTPAAAPGAPATPAAGVRTDAGATSPVATDAGARAGDSGAAPAPTPTFQIPTAIPGFDAGAWTPPAGIVIPTTLPTWPPPPPAK